MAWPSRAETEKVVHALVRILLVVEIPLAMADRPAESNNQHATFPAARAESNVVNAVERLVTNMSASVSITTHPFLADELLCINWIDKCDDYKPHVWIVWTQSSIPINILVHD
jgi:hypothetical protein